MDSSVFIGYWWGGWEVEAVGVRLKERLRERGAFVFVCLLPVHVRGTGVKYIRVSKRSVRLCSIPSSRLGAGASGRS